jgi:hypothetical protein
LREHFRDKRGGNMEKPQILSEKQIGDLLDIEEEYVYYCSDGSRKHTLNCWPVVKAQLDADVAYYEPLIQQAKAEVAREIKERLRLSLVKNYCRTERCQSTYCRLCYGTMNPLCQFLECIIGESLKSKYGGQK